MAWQSSGHALRVLHATSMGDARYEAGRTQDQPFGAVPLWKIIPNLVVLAEAVVRSALTGITLRPVALDRDGL